jgi:pimeloyl-ACP methyl ester carboxylesterase
MSDPTQLTPQSGDVTSRDGVSIHYQVVGSGPPLLLLSGWQETAAASFGELVDHLAERFTLIIVDNRGVGRSGRAHGYFQGWTLDRMADDAEQVLETLGVQRTYVLGKSLGGMVTQELSHRMQSRDRVAGEILLDTAPGWFFPPWAHPIWTSWQVLKVIGQKIPKVRDWKIFQNGEASQLADPPSVHVQLDDPVGKNVSSIQQILTVGSMFWPWELRHVKAPTLVITGERDGVTPLYSAGRLLHRIIKGSTLVRVPLATHSVVHDNVQPVADAVDAFLTRLQAAAPLPALVRPLGGGLEGVA